MTIEKSIPVPVSDKLLVWLQVQDQQRRTPPGLIIRRLLEEMMNS